MSEKAEKFEGGSEKGIEKEVPLTDEEMRYLRALVSREQAASRLGGHPEEEPDRKMRDALLSKLR